MDTTTLEIGVEISVLGIKLGNFYGNLKQGLVIKINLIAASGFIRFFLRGREVWVEVDVSVIFDGTFKKEVKLFTI